MEVWLSSAAGAPERRDRLYGGRSAHERRTDRRARLVAAGLELFGTRGIAATRVDDVCAEAGLTKRYFYENFAGLAELVEEVLAAVVGDLRERVMPLYPGLGGDPRPALAAFIDALMADPRLIQILIIETNNGELVHHRQSLVDTAVATWLEAETTGSRDARVLAYAFTGAAGEIAVASLTGRLKLTPEQITDHLVDIYERLTK